MRCSVASPAAAMRLTKCNDVLSASANILEEENDVRSSEGLMLSLKVIFSAQHAAFRQALWLYRYPTTQSRRSEKASCISTHHEKHSEFQFHSNNTHFYCVCSITRTSNKVPSLAPCIRQTLDLRDLVKLPRQHTTRF
jgi:hypothetical protein